MPYMSRSLAFFDNQIKTCVHFVKRKGIDKIRVEYKVKRGRAKCECDLKSRPTHRSQSSVNTNLSLTLMQPLPKQKGRNGKKATGRGFIPINASPIDKS